jgi:hypothetical protein
VIQFNCSRITGEGSEARQGLGYGHMAWRVSAGSGPDLSDTHRASSTPAVANKTRRNSLLSAAQPPWELGCFAINPCSGEGAVFSGQAVGISRAVGVLAELGARVSTLGPGSTRDVTGCQNIFILQLPNFELQVFRNRDSCHKDSLVYQGPSWHDSGF